MLTLTRRPKLDYLSFWTPPLRFFFWTWDVHYPFLSYMDHSISSSFWLRLKGGSITTYGFRSLDVSLNIVEFSANVHTYISTDSLPRTMTAHVPSSIYLNLTIPTTWKYSFTEIFHVGHWCYQFDLYFNMNSCYDDWSIMSSYPVYRLERGSIHGTSKENVYYGTYGWSKRTRQRFWTQVEFVHWISSEWDKNFRHWGADGRIWHPSWTSRVPVLEVLSMMTP